MHTYSCCNYSSHGTADTQSIPQRLDSTAHWWRTFDFKNEKQLSEVIKAIHLKIRITNKTFLLQYNRLRSTQLSWTEAFSLYLKIFYNGLYLVDCLWEYFQWPILSTSHLLSNVHSKHYFVKFREQIDQSASTLLQSFAWCWWWIVCHHHGNEQVQRLQ